MADEKTTDTKQGKQAREKIPPAIYPDIPENRNQVDYDYILDYIFDKGEKEIEWLKEILSISTGKTKNGKDKKIPYISLRNKFVEEYMPDLMPEPKQRKPNMNDRFDERMKMLEASKKPTITKRK